MRAVSALEAMHRDLGSTIRTSLEEALVDEEALLEERWIERIEVVDPLREVEEGGRSATHPFQNRVVVDARQRSGNRRPHLLVWLVWEELTRDTTERREGVPASRQDILVHYI